MAMDDDLDAVIEPFLASDLAREVVNVYDERRGYNIEAGYATQAVFEAFGDLLADPDEGPVIFLAVAAMQVRDGMVLRPIQEAALAMIDSGEAQRAWRQVDASINIQRKSALKALAERLRTTPTAD